MMDIRTYILTAFVVSATVAAAQPPSAEAYFNQASREFVKMDKLTALRTLDRGLQHYPGDPKLLKLAEELVKEEQRKQQEEQQKKEQQDQKDKEKDKEKGDGKGDQQKEEQADQQDKPSEQDQAGKDGKEQQQDPSQDKAEQGKSNEEKQKAERAKAGQIAPQDAIRMLEALERSEKEVQSKVRAKRRPASRRTIEKDW